MKSMIFFNTGWMQKYQGLSNDPITGGGAYVQEHGYGHEIFNFKPYNGFMYGYVQARGGIDIERLGASEKDAAIDGVLIIWVARDPQRGAVIVGWYDNATVYRDWQPAPTGSKRDHKGEQLGFRVRAKQEDCRLLPVDKRVLRVPRRKKGGMGQSNVWYADHPESAAFKQAVLKFVATGVIPHANRSSAKRGRAWQPDPYKRKKIEEKAIELAVKHYKSLGYTVGSVEKDNTGWDLEATLDNKFLRLEVKGLSEMKLSMEMTPNEYQKSQDHKDSYRICVVNNVLGKKPILRVFAYLSESGAWEDDEGKQLLVTEIVSARMSLPSG